MLCLLFLYLLSEFTFVEPVDGTRVVSCVAIILTKFETEIVWGYVKLYLLSAIIAKSIDPHWYAAAAVLTIRQLYWQGIDLSRSLFSKSIKQVHW